MENIYTDLALEMAELLGTDDGPSLDGVEVESEEQDGILIHTVRVLDEAGENVMGKPRGSYITIESPDMKINSVTVHEEIIEILTEKLASLAAGTAGTVLVIGLGNSNVTPDSLGPLVVSKVLVTRHIMEGLPVELEGSLRSVCALAPGVMGLTGIETLEVVKGLVSRVKPALVIAIDALAARKISRINQTIQLTDTGISPGAGIGNKRLPLNRQSLGVPVIAIGVPTVADAAVFASDAMDEFFSCIESSAPDLIQGGEGFLDMLKSLGDNEKHAAIKTAITPLVGNMFVTPKEIGEVVSWLANIIANAINMAMHEGISREDINRYVY